MRLTLAQCKALADELDERDEAAYADALHTAAQAAHFEHCSRRQLVRMWETGRNLKGRKLSEFEFKALCEAWVRVFNSIPPADGGTGGSLALIETKPTPQPDMMLDMHEVGRLAAPTLNS